MLRLLSFLFIQFIFYSHQRKEFFQLNVYLSKSFLCKVWELNRNISQNSTINHVTRKFYLATKNLLIMRIFGTIQLCKLFIMICKQYFLHTTAHFLYFSSRDFIIKLFDENLRYGELRTCLWKFRWDQRWQFSFLLSYKMHL